MTRENKNLTRMKIKGQVEHSNKEIYPPFIVSIESNKIVEDSNNDDNTKCVSKKSSKYSKEARFYVIGGICLFTSVVCSLTLWVQLNNFKLGKFYSYIFSHLKIKTR